MFWKSTYNELIKIVAKPRSYIGFGAITLIIGIILFAMLVDGMTYLSFIIQLFDQSISFQGTILNGNLVSFIILQMLIVHVPLLIALVTGDLISGEAAMGTIRFLVTKPISRTSLFFSKYIAGCIYSFLIVLWIAFLSLVVSKLLFGDGDLMILKSQGLVVLPFNDVVWRFVSALSMAYLGLVVVATLSITLSCFSENSISPIVLTMAIIILFTIIGALDVSILDPIRPLLFTTQMSMWNSFFEDPIPKQQIIHSAILLVMQIIILLSIALFKFKRKDILT